MIVLETRFWNKPVEASRASSSFESIKVTKVWFKNGVLCGRSEEKNMLLWWFSVICSLISFSLQPFEFLHLFFLGKCEQLSQISSDTDRISAKRCGCRGDIRAHSHSWCPSKCSLSYSFSRLTICLFWCISLVTLLGHKLFYFWKFIVAQKSQSIFFISSVP